MCKFKLASQMLELGTGWELEYRLGFQNLMHLNSKGMPQEIQSALILQWDDILQTCLLWCSVLLLTLVGSGIT